MFYPKPHVGASSPPSPDISLILPVYNEEESLPELIRELRDVLEEISLTFEILFIDDGSHDGSNAILNEAAQKDNRIKVIRFKKNCGQSAALPQGFKPPEDGL